MCFIISVPTYASVMPQPQNGACLLALFAHRWGWACCKVVASVTEGSAVHVTNIASTAWHFYSRLVNIRVLLILARRLLGSTDVSLNHQVSPDLALAIIVFRTTMKHHLWVSNTECNESEILYSLRDLTLFPQGISGWWTAFHMPECMYRKYFVDRIQ